jgi:hypothetical protein
VRTSVSEEKTWPAAKQKTFGRAGRANGLVKADGDRKFFGYFFSKK